MKILKWMLGLLLAVNLMVLAYTHWGGDLMGEDSISQSQPLLNAEKIKLLNAPVSSPVVTHAIVPTAAPVVTRATTCMEWGEFSGNNLAHAAQALTALNLGNSIARRQVEHDNGYWVYMPPRNSRAEVDRKIKELKDLGVTDYFVVQDSKIWLNTISLGIFKTEDAAQSFLDKLKAKGVRSAVMGKRDGKLRFVVFELNNLNPAMTEKISALQKQFADSELKIVDCAKANAN